MSPFLLPVLFIVGGLASVAVLHLRKQPTTGHRPPSTVYRRQPVVTTTPRPRPIDYAAERQLIRLALAGGMAPGAVAGLLRGSPSARRRRVLKIARELARPAPAQQPRVEVATA